MRTLIGAIWTASLVSMTCYGLSFMATLLWLGQHPVRLLAERAVYALLALLVLIVLGSVVWMAQRTTPLNGQVRYGWVLLFALWQIVLGLVAAFVTLVALNQ